MNERNMAAIDLGASSGRVMLSIWQPRTRRLSLREVHRFDNRLTRIDGHDTWDIDGLEREIRKGLAAIDEQGVALDSIGIDTWAVDYVLLDKQRNRIGLPYSYRDHRTDGVMERTIADIGRSHLYRRTGIQFLPFNTLYQLKALREQQPDICGKAAHLLMIPDYFHFRLTGQLNCEYTNASTTQLLNLATGDWDEDLIDYLDVPRQWFLPPNLPGNTVGYWTSPSGRKVPVIATATHDTASAVVATPLGGTNSLYLSSGTWSLMGMESAVPFNDQNAMAANITNEGGIGNTYRVLKNIMGLWLLQRVCQEQDVDDLPGLVAAAAALPAFTSLIDPNNDRFINPPSMVAEIRAACREQHQRVPETSAELARCIFDSLAMLYRQASLELARLRGISPDKLHIVGGGSKNRFLNQLSADVCQLPIVAGPEEASALGNIGCQLMALQEVGNLTDFRHLVAYNFPLRHCTANPMPDFAGHWRRFLTICHCQEELAV